VNDFKQILSPLTVPPTKGEDSDFYSDYGSDTGYHTRTGKGEKICLKSFIDFILESSLPLTIL